MEVKEMIIHNIVDTAGDETTIYNYFKGKYGIQWLHTM
jgi:hypothetical protein